MTALLIVDLQNDFLPGGALGIEEADQIIPVINQLLEMPFDIVVATQDWHPSDHVSFAHTHQKSVGETIQLEDVEQVLWPKHCVQKTKGAELHPLLKMDNIDKFIYKGTDTNIDSYSAFFDNAHKKSTHLHEYLAK